MDLILRDILKRSGLWESYKTKHNIVENVSLWNFMDPYMKAAEEALTREIVEYGNNEDHFKFVYNIEHGNPEYDDIEDTEHYEAWLKEKIEELIFDAAGTLRGVTMEDGEIMLYRVITAPPDWVQQGGLSTRPLGEYWSWEEGAAEAHWGSFDSDHEQYLLVASANPKSVDWTKSIYANADPSAEDEKEVAVLPGTKVRLHGVYVMQNNRPVGVESGLEGQILQAA